MRLRFDSHSSSHPLGSFAHISQADAGSGILFVAVQALEDAENTMLMFARDAYAVVLNRQTHPVSAIFCPNTKTRFLSCCDKLETIGKQIHQHLHQDAFVGPDIGQRGFHADFSLLLLYLRLAL